jgi:glycine cleavage system H protein
LYPQDLRYTRDHEWIRVDGGRGRVGITFHAQEQLGDVVFVDLPKSGTPVEQGKTFGVVESVKTASDLYAPASGTVVEVNDKLVDRPELVNQDPYGEGWMIVVELSHPSQISSLLSAAEYEATLPK